MRIEIAGAQITDAVVEVLDTLQNQTELTSEYLQILDEQSIRHVLRRLDISGNDEEADSRILSRLRALQMIRRDLLALAMPFDIDNQENDIASFQA